MASIRIQKYRWLLELGFLVMLAALALTVRRDSMGLRASEHKTAASGPIAVTASFETKDWPRNLRTDLRRATITVALPMVQALERSHRWIGALSPPDVVRHLEDDSLRIWKMATPRSCAIGRTPICKACSPSQAFEIASASPYAPAKTVPTRDMPTFSAASSSWSANNQATRTLPSNCSSF